MAYVLLKNGRMFEIASGELKQNDQGKGHYRIANPTTPTDNDAVLSYDAVIGLFNDKPEIREGVCGDDPAGADPPIKVVWMLLCDGRVLLTEGYVGKAEEGHYWVLDNLKKKEIAVLSYDSVTGIFDLKPNVLAGLDCIPASPPPKVVWALLRDGRVLQVDDGEIEKVKEEGHYRITGTIAGDTKTVAILSYHSVIGVFDCKPTILTP